MVYNTDSLVLKACLPTHGPHATSNWAAATACVTLKEHTNSKHRCAGPVVQLSFRGESTVLFQPDSSFPLRLQSSTEQSGLV